MPPETHTLLVFTLQGHQISTLASPRLTPRSRNNNYIYHLFPGAFADTLTAGLVFVG